MAGEVRDLYRLADRHRRRGRFAEAIDAVNEAAAVTEEAVEEMDRRLAEIKAAVSLGRPLAAAGSD